MRRLLFIVFSCFPHLLNAQDAKSHADMLAERAAANPDSVKTAALAKLVNDLFGEGK